LSEIGGKICEKAFRRCIENSNPYILKINQWRQCRTYPCPCQLYTDQYVMRQANKIIKYGRI
jgi:hypothetical protein